MTTVRAKQVRATIALVIVALLFGTGQQLTRPLLTPHAVSLGADVVWAGVVVAAQGLGGLTAALLVGVAIDTVGGRRVMGTGAVVFCLAAGVMAAATTPVTLTVGNFVFGFGGVATWLSAQTLSTVALDDGATRRRVARVSTAVLAGHLCGPPLGGLLADNFSVRVAFLATTVLGFALLPAALAYPRRLANHDDHAATTSEEQPTATSARALLRRTGFLAVVSATAIGTALQTTRQFFLPLHFDARGWNATEIGIILSIAGAGAVLSRTSLTAFDRWLSPPAIVGLCLIPGALSLGMAVSVNSTILVGACVAVSGFSLGLTQPVTLLYTARLTSQRERGRAVSLRVAANRVVQTAMPIAFGAIAGLIGLVAAFWFLVGASSVASSSVSWFSRRWRE